MRYAGPLVLATRDLRALFDFCSEANILFYYWGMTGAQYVAVRDAAMAGIDPAKLPAAFRNLEWRNAPMIAKPEDVAEVVKPEAAEPEPVVEVDDGGRASPTVT